MALSESTQAEGNGGSRPRLLVLHDPAGPGTGAAVPAGDGDGDTVAMEFRRLSCEVLQQVAPDIVIAPVVAVTFDCMDVARRLVDCEYSGLLRVVIARLPRPDLVAGELAASYPMLDVDFVEVDPPAG